MKHKRMIACLLTCILLVSTGVGIGYLIGRGSSMPQQKEATGYVENPAYEYLVGAAAWQMSAEAHALMIQGFHIAEENINDIVELADASLDGYHWVVEEGKKIIPKRETSMCCL